MPEFEQAKPAPIPPSASAAVAKPSIETSSPARPPAVSRPDSMTAPVAPHQRVPQEYEPRRRPYQPRYGSGNKFDRDNPKPVKPKKSIFERIRDAVATLLGGLKKAPKGKPENDGDDRDDRRYNNYRRGNRSNSGRGGNRGNYQGGGNRQQGGPRQQGQGGGGQRPPQGQGGGQYRGPHGGGPGGGQRGPSPQGGQQGGQRQQNYQGGNQQGGGPRPQGGQGGNYSQGGGRNRRNQNRTPRGNSGGPARDE